jgi:GTPase
MNRFNPLYMGAFLIFMLLFFALKLSSAKEELTLVKEEYKETAVTLNELSSLSSAYMGKEEVKKSLQRILAQPSLKSANISQKLKNNSIVVTASSVDKEALNSLMGKLLNGAYDIAAFNIKKLSDNKASFEVEIQW